MSNALQAIPTEHGLAVLTSHLIDTVTEYSLVGALTHDATELHVFYSATIEASYFDEHGVLTYLINLPIEQHFDEYLHQINILDVTGASIIECLTPKVALAQGVGGVVTLKIPVTGEAGEVVFKHGEYITEPELVDLFLSPILADLQSIKDAANEHLAAENPHPQYALASLVRSLSSNTFNKSQTSEPAFMLAGGQLRTASAMTVRVGDALVTHAANEEISTPVLMLGVDYAIYATADGLIVSNNFTVPDGYTEDNSRRIGGFHYGDNEFKTHSFYDLHFRPKCKDPRGVVLDMGERFWADIYLTNTAPNLLGTSAYDAQIADGSSTPKIPAQLGGDGVQQYANYSQFAANELLACYGKRLPNYQEFQMLARGSVSGYVRGSDPVKTLFDSSARSIIGCEQVSGNMWQWGCEVWDRGNGTSGYVWHNIAEGYGQMYAAHSAGVGASLFGERWDESGRAGSRASLWYNEPAGSASGVGSRGVCGHLVLA